MNDSSIYQLRNIRKSHGPTFSLQLGDLQVHRGEVLGLVGPTGAGKSTLLRLLAGLELKDFGEAVFEGKPISAPNVPMTIRRRIAMVHQRPMLLTGTTRWNIEYGLRLRRDRETTRKVDAVLDRLGLLKIASQSAQTLSGGQTQLVALARAIVIEPDVLLLDEPTANLDPANVALVEGVIRNIQLTHRVTVVWATHNLFQARRVATRLGLLLNGQLVEIAATRAFFEDPVDSRTADFVQGRMVY